VSECWQGESTACQWGAAILVYLLIPDGIVTLVCAAQQFIENPAAQRLAPAAAYFFSIKPIFFLISPKIAAFHSQQTGGSHSQATKNPARFRAKA